MQPHPVYLDEPARGSEAALGHARRSGVDCGKHTHRDRADEGERDDGAGLGGIDQGHGILRVALVRGCVLQRSMGAGGAQMLPDKGHHHVRLVHIAVLPGRGSSADLGPVQKVRFLPRPTYINSTKPETLSTSTWDRRPWDRMMPSCPCLADQGTPDATRRHAPVLARPLCRRAGLLASAA